MRLKLILRNGIVVELNVKLRKLREYVEIIGSADMDMDIMDMDIMDMDMNMN